MLRPASLLIRKRHPFEEGSHATDEDRKRFNIRDQNEILKEFLEEHKDAVAELVDGPIDDISPVTKIFLSGRVRIEVPIIRQEIVPYMTCEECEKEDAVAKCEECDEVFCERCLDLCHEKNWTKNTLHAHYLNNSIRELKVGDSSKVNLYRPYVLPEYECYDTDDDLNKNKNIAHPYSLVVPSTLRHRKMTTPLIKPKYTVGDTILYLDFQSPSPDEPVFGVIVSEWDFRHGDSAPTITRGQDCVMWYVIRRLDEKLYYDPYEPDEKKSEDTTLLAIESGCPDGQVDDSCGDIDDTSQSSLVSEYSTMTVTTATTKKSCLYKGPTRRDDIPVIEGVQDVPLRKSLAMAKEVNKRAALAKQIRTFGSKLHFSSLFTAKVKNTGGTYPQSSYNTQDNISVISSESSFDQSMSEESKLTKHQWHMLQARPEADSINYRVDEESMAVLSDVIENNTGSTRLKDVSDTYIVMSGLQEKGINTITENGRLLPASKRTYYHVYEDDGRFAAIDRSGSWDWNAVSCADERSQDSVVARDMLKVLVMPENEIHEPKDYFKKILGQKQLKFKEIVKKSFVKIFAAQLQSAFDIWVSLMYEQIFLEETIATTAIQAVARRWLSRNVIQDIRDGIQKELERRRAIMHTSMKYSTVGAGKSTKGGSSLVFTMDNRRFFDTRRDMNRYAFHLRVEISKVIYFLNIRRNAILSQAIGRWKKILHEAFLESDLKSGHILLYSDNALHADSMHGFNEMKASWREQITAEMTMDEYRQDVKRIHANLRAAFEASREEYSKVMAAPLRSAESDTHSDRGNKALLRFQMPERKVLGRGDTNSDHNILDVPLAIPKPGGSNDEDEDGIYSPFHPTIALRAKPKDLTTGCAGGYSNTREGDLIFSNDDHGASSASKETNCVTIDTSFSTKTAYGSVSRIGKDGSVSRINPNDNKLKSLVKLETVNNGVARLKRNNSVEALKDGHLLSVLPPLPIIPVSQDQKGNLAFTKENKPKYNSLRCRLEGPTEYSCWIIPGLLAMGTVPVGRAWRRRQVKTSVHTRIDAASQLVLSGISTFVSLLSPENEAVAEKRCPISLELSPERGGLGVSTADVQPGRMLEYCLPDIVSKSRFELKNVISGFKSQIENWNADIQLNVVDDPLDMRYEASLKEDLRLRARRAIAIECSDKAKLEHAQLPNSELVKSEFVRMPIEQDFAPDLNDFLPLLWALERRLMAGERLYIYSLEGHGRCGLVCGCLLGRLYGLTPRETLFRMQVYHDSIASQVRRLVPINCPQLINQQELLSSVLKNTNRVFDGVTLRSQINPETYTSELHHLERGSQVGVYGVAITEGVEHRTVPTVYHSAGGRSKASWVDNDKRVFDEPLLEPMEQVQEALPSRRRFTPSNGGYSKHGLRIRNSHSMEEEGTKEASPSRMASPSASIEDRKTRRSKLIKKKQASRRATMGSCNIAQSESESENEDLAKIKRLQEEFAAAEAHAKQQASNLSLPCAESRQTFPYKIKVLRPAPAEAPKLPSIQSKYGDIA